MAVGAIPVNGGDNTGAHALAPSSAGLVVAAVHRTAPSVSAVVSAGSGKPAVIC